VSDQLEIVSRGMFGRTIFIDDFGVRRGRVILAWDDVDHYVHEWLDWRSPAEIVLVGRRRRMIRVAPNFAVWHRAAGKIFAELHPRLRPQPFFDPFVVEGDVLVQAASGRLPLAEIEHVEIASIGQNVVLVVHARGAGEWIQMDVALIANLWLFLELLADRGVALRTSLDLFLPSSLSDLAERIAVEDDRRGGRVPGARLVRP
jgi:hypothetical protein